MNFEAPIMGDDLPDDVDLTGVQTVANVMFDMMLEVLYNGKSEEYKNILNEVKSGQ